MHFKVCQFINDNNIFFISQKANKTKKQDSKDSNLFYNSRHQIECMVVVSLPRFESLKEFESNFESLFKSFNCLKENLRPLKMKSSTLNSVQSFDIS